MLPRVVLARCSIVNQYWRQHVTWNKIAAHSDAHGIRRPADLCALQQAATTTALLALRAIVPPRVGNPLAVVAFERAVALRVQPFARALVAVRVLPTFVRAVGTIRLEEVRLASGGAARAVVRQVALQHGVAAEAARALELARADIAAAPVRAHFAGHQRARGRADGRTAGADVALLPGADDAVAAVRAPNRLARVVGQAVGRLM